MERVVIVGGGISGLATAWRLQQAAARSGRALDVTVLEADTRAGGKMWTDREDGFAIEQGPNGFLDSRPNALALVRDLAAGDLLLRANEKSKKRFICRDGRLERLPEKPGPFLKSRLLSPRAKLRLLGEPWASPPPAGDETVGDFAARRLGPEARDFLIDPMVSGVFAGDSSRISLQSAFPRVRELERQYGGLFRGMFGVMKERKRAGGKGEVSAGPGGTLTSFHGGVKTLVDTMAARLGASLRTGAPVTGLRRTGAGWLVTARIDDRDVLFPADALVLACPSDDAARLLDVEAPNLARALAGIASASITVVATAFRRDEVAPESLDGFGFLVPSVEQRPILGTLFDSSIFPDRAPAGQVLLRSMVGGARHPELAALPDDAVTDAVLGELRDLMGLRAAPTRVRIVRWARGIPQYNVGHAARMARIDAARARLPGLYLCHNSYRGISLDDCCREATGTAAAVEAFLS